MKILTNFGVLGLLMTLILTVGGCKMENDPDTKPPSPPPGSLGKEAALELETKLKTDKGVSVTVNSYDGVVTSVNDVLPFSGTIANAKLKGSVTNELLSGTCQPLTVNAASGLVNLYFADSSSKSDFYKDITLNATDVNFAELQLQVKLADKDNTKVPLLNGKTEALLNLPITQMHGTWVWVSKDVTITGIKKEYNWNNAFSLSPVDDLNLTLKQGWNCIYRELELKIKTLSGAYVVEIKNYENWYVDMGVDAE